MAEHDAGRWSAMAGRIPARLVTGVVIMAASGCADRAPPASWPQPEPPSLADPLPPAEDGVVEDGERTPVDEAEARDDAEVEPEDPSPEPAEAPGSGTPSSGA